MGGVDSIGDGLELLLAGAEAGEGAGGTQGRVLGEKGGLLLLRPLLALHGKWWWWWEVKPPSLSFISSILVQLQPGRQ